ncbi:hypothetical protein ES703_13913 [subsurface metagenome]
MVEEKRKTDQPAEQPDPEQPDLEALIAELPAKFQPVIRNLVTGVFNSLVQANERIAELEKKPAQAADQPGMFEGMTTEQRYQILMTRAQAPAAQAQMGLYQALLGGLKGGNTGGGIDSLLSSAEKIQALRALIMPEPSPLQVAMEKANIQQMLAQSRLMNKVAGKETSAYLDKLEKEIAE